MLNLTLIIVAYLSGSISSAIIVCKLAGLPDPRSTGSKNPGATNVFRIGSKVHAFFTLLGDLLKGLIPTVAAIYLEVPDWVLALTMLAAFLGHLYPAFFGFQGGKGVATAIGCVLGLDFQFGLTVVMIWLLVVLVFKVSSLGALISFAFAPFIYLWYFATEIELTAAVFLALLLISIFIFVKHRENIINLIKGEEGKIAGKDD